MAAMDDTMVDWPPEHEAAANGSAVQAAIPLSHLQVEPSTATDHQDSQNGHASAKEGAGLFPDTLNAYITARGENRNPPDPVQTVPLPDAPLPRPLDSFDVAAFIVNKMIGTGIFTTPVTVLIQTHNDKELALGLWILGFVYTLIRYCTATPGVDTTDLRMKQLRRVQHDNLSRVCTKATSYGRRTHICIYDISLADFRETISTRLPANANPARRNLQDA